MKYAELIKKLECLGCQFKRQAAGSHEIWFNPQARCSAPIPCHLSKDISKNLLSKILRELNIDRKDFDRA
jgi:predicted RNA binding protein YcfA (HicA-like mRNA interferase family)